MNRLVLSLGLAAMLAGCGVSVEDVCDDLADSCVEVASVDCQRDGERIEAASDDLGCVDLFDAYLDCVDEASCAYDTRCEGEREELETCVELTPPD